MLASFLVFLWLGWLPVVFVLLQLAITKPYHLTTTLSSNRNLTQKEQITPAATASTPTATANGAFLVPAFITTPTGLIVSNVHTLERAHKQGIPQGHGSLTLTRQSTHDRRGAVEPTHHPKHPPHLLPHITSITSPLPILSPPLRLLHPRKLPNNPALKPHKQHPRPHPAQHPARHQTRHTQPRHDGAGGQEAGQGVDGAEGEAGALAAVAVGPAAEGRAREGRGEEACREEAGDEGRGEVVLC